MKWEVVYKKAIYPDGRLLFPKKHSVEFLQETRKIMGSYLYANQYLNEVIPDDEKRFKKEWLTYIEEIPENTYKFAFIDPAIGQKDHNDYTGIAIVEVDSSGTWYLRLAARYRFTPTEIIQKLFELQEAFHLNAIGIEIVAYQEALLYMLDEESKRRKTILPVKDIRRTRVSKETRILGLVPRFEWKRIQIARGMIDFEDEFATFPRSSHDDILDAVASLEELVYYPEKKEKKIEKPHTQAADNYEAWYIQNIDKQKKEEDYGTEYE